MANIPILSFNAGEVTPQIDARSDVDKYDSACRELENMIPRIYGTAERRPGFQYIYESKNSPQGSRLIPFIYSSEIAYMCEFGDLYARFYYNKAILLDSSSVPVEVVTPYLVADLPALQYDQLADTMWLVHGSYAPAKLTRTSATAFSHDNTTFTRGPFRTRNDIANDDDVTMTPGATTGSTTLTASSATFDDDHVGALFSLTQPRETTIVTQSGAGTSSAIDVFGNFTWTTHGTWTGTVKLERNVDGAGWETYRTQTSSNDANIQLSATEKEYDTQYRITVVAGVSGTVTSDINVHDSTQTGIARITSVVNSTIANVTVLHDFSNTDATKRWAEGAWSTYRGFPTSFCFFENRAVYGKDQTLWFSKTDSYEDFREDLSASDSFSITLLTTNEIRWIASLEALAVGTSGNEWRVQSNKLDTPITPTNFSAKEQTRYGSAELQAVKVNDVVLFADYVRRRVREFTYNDQYGKYVAPDLTALAEHITTSGITSMAHQKNPDSILWATRADGTLLSMSYDRAQDVIGWARHIVAPSQVDTTGKDWGISEAAAYKYTYIAENGTVWGVPINYFDRTTLCLDLDGVAVDNGDGTVGLPCTRHPFAEDDVIQIGDTTNYSAGTLTVTAATTENVIVVTDTYNAETFSGTEPVIRKVAVEAGVGRMDQDEDGNLYVGNVASITKYDTDGNKTETFFTPAGAGFPANADIFTGVKVSKDNNFLYAYLYIDDVSDTGMLYKFNLSDGEQVWATSTGTGPGYNIDVDEDNNVYVCQGGVLGNAEVQKVTAAGVAAEFASTAGVYACHVSDAKERVVFGGRQIGNGAQEPTLYNLCICDLDGTNISTAQVGGTYYTGSGYSTHIIGSEKVYIIGEYVYTLFENTDDGKWYLYKLNQSDLSTDSYIQAPDNSIGMFRDFNDQLVLVIQNWDSPVTSEIFQFYDYDLNALGTITENYPDYLCKNWTPNTGAAWNQGQAVFYPGIPYDDAISEYSQTATGTVESVAVIPSTTEDEVWISALLVINDDRRRYIMCMKPRVFTSLTNAFYVDAGVTVTNSTASTTLSGLDHLIGETVAVLGDGTVYEPTAVVDADGEVTISTAVSTAQVGLPYRYKLKPMRPDVNTGTGTSHGSRVKIAEMALSFINTLDAQYGVDYDNLYDVDWTNERWTNNSDITGLYTGDFVVHSDGGFSLDSPLIITGIKPLPCSLRAMVPRQHQTGR